METIVFISRHSLTLSYKNVNSDIDVLSLNMMTPLSIEGEKRAFKMANYSELKDVEVIYSSPYSRAMATAKYVASDRDINADYRLGERIHGIKKDYSELPKNFSLKQLSDENFKFQNGESREEVAKRMREILFKIIEKHRGKKIYITSHSMAMISLFGSFGRIEVNGNDFKIIINDKVLTDSSYNWEELSPELFRLVFEGDELKSIEFIDYTKESSI